MITQSVEQPGYLLFTPNTITAENITALINQVKTLIDENVKYIALLISSGGGSVSAGLLIFPVAGYSEQDLMASVDIAMYKAKDSGRGRWCLASMDDLNRGDARKRVNWKSKIEKALEEQRFLLYFQPIMCIADKSISRYECLLKHGAQDPRWNKTRFGLVLQTEPGYRDGPYSRPASKAVSAAAALITFSMKSPCWMLFRTATSEVSFPKTV